MIKDKSEIHALRRVQEGEMSKLHQKHYRELERTRVRQLKELEEMNGEEDMNEIIKATAKMENPESSFFVCPRCNQFLHSGQACVCGLVWVVMAVGVEVK